LHGRKKVLSRNEPFQLIPCAKMRETPHQQIY
jgi:hypothetical protein